jgi:hypothetical protein
MLGTFFVCSLFGQNAEISGFVRDASDAVVPAARVRVINQDTASERATTPDGSGLYSVPALPPGRYRMTVSADGFESESRNDITVETAQNVRIDFTLKIGASKEVVTVNGNQSYVNQSDATVSTMVDRQFVENVPLNGRTLQSLLTLVPGVATVPGSGQVGYQGEITVNGQRTESNYFTVDGVSANSGAKIDNETGGAGYSGAIPGMTIIGTTQTMVSLDDLQEFRAATSTYSAEFGRTPGGQFAFTTRSGTNSYHGTLFDYFRNDALDAANWFNHYYNPAIDVLNTPNDFPKAAERQNDFGGTVGGPVDIPGLYNGEDKTFFFLFLRGDAPRSAGAAVELGGPRYGHAGGSAGRAEALSKRLCHSEWIRADTKSRACKLHSGLFGAFRRRLRQCAHRPQFWQQTAGLRSLCRHTLGRLVL